MSHVGSYAPNFHEGKRSEYLAQYFFFARYGCSSSGAEDAGLDLHCTIADVVGQRAWPRCFYTLQVKSEFRPWKIESSKSVEWVATLKFPLFLCIVEKKVGRFRLYHTLARHLLHAHPPLPDRFEFVPEDRAEGQSVQWSREKGSLSLSAPVLDFGLDKFMDESYVAVAKNIIAEWVRWDDLNTHIRSSGIFQAAMPTKYKANEPLIPTQAPCQECWAIGVGEGLRPLPLKTWCAT